MAQTLQNQITYAKSMNGIVTLSDGAGTTISNGTINTDTIDVDNFNATNFTANNVIVDYMQILRDSNPVVNAALGFTVDVGLLVQNMIFQDVPRLFQIWNDTATSPILQINTGTGDTNINSDYLNVIGQQVFLTATQDLHLSGTDTVDVSSPIITFTNSSVSFPTSLVSFNSNLPTSTVTPSLDTHLITRTYADSRYGQLVAQNAWTALNTFNNVLPRSTITTATLNAQFVTKGIADGFYGRLTATNTWTLTNTFSTGIIPRAASSITDIQIGGNNQLQYRTSPSAYNVSIGENACRGYPAQPTWNVGQRNVGISDSALQNIMGGSDNIACGYQAMQICGDGAVYGQTVTPSQNVAIGTFSQKTNLYGVRNITLGYNSYPNNVGGIGNVIIAANGGGGLSDKSYCVIIGDGACPTAADNGIIAIGANALGAAVGGANSVIAIGQQAGYVNSAAGCLFIGTQSGNSNTTGYDNQFIGYLSGIGNSNGLFNQYIGRETRTTKSNVQNSCCVGYKATTVADYEFVIGGTDGISYPRLTLPEKTRLACNQALTGATITLAFRTNENILLTDATTTTINLQTPNTNGVNEGCKFYINRKVAGVNITINAPAGQTIALNQINGTYTASSTYLFLAGMNSITILCIGSAAGGTNWQVLPTSYAQGTDNVYISTVNPIPTASFSIPFAGTTVSGYQPYFMDNANLNYQQSTQKMTVQNLTVTNTLTGNLTGNASTATNSTNATNATNSINSTNVNVIDKTGIAGPYYVNFTSNVSGNLPVNADSNLYYDPLGIKLLLSNGTFQSYKTNSTCYQYLSQGTLITAATSIGAPLLSYYPFTMTTAAAYSITLPQITVLNVGTQITFKRVSGSLQPLSITAVNNQPTFLSGGTIGTVTATNVIISASQSCCKITAILAQKSGAGTFDNAAGSATITVVTVSGTTVLSIGGFIVLNGNIRFITAYGSGLGKTGTYTVNATIATANSGAAFNTGDTFGWSIDSVC